MKSAEISRKFAGKSWRKSFQTHENLLSLHFKINPVITIVLIKCWRSFVELSPKFGVDLKFQRHHRHQQHKVTFHINFLCLLLLLLLFVIASCSLFLASHPCRCRRKKVYMFFGCSTFGCSLSHLFTSSTFSHSCFLVHCLGDFRGSLNS